MVSILLVDSLFTVRQVPAARTANREQQQVIGRLLAERATRVWSDYWTCNRLTFLSRERVVCATLDDQLRIGDNRYRPYLEIVEADDPDTMLFPAHSPQAQDLAQRCHTRPVRITPTYFLFRVRFSALGDC
jgi:hypothetical protein